MATRKASTDGIRKVLFWRKAPSLWLFLGGSLMGMLVVPAADIASLQTLVHAHVHQATAAAAAPAVTR